MNNKIYHVQEGEIIAESLIKDFRLKDFDLRGRNKNIVDFTGIIVLQNQILIAWPKHYFTQEDLQSDITSKDPKPLFSLILKNVKTLADSNLNGNDGLDSDIYPLKEFREVVEYYQSYGLYHELEKRNTIGYKGKINWKKTITKSAKIVSNGNLLFTPFTISQERNKAVFLSECMAYIINETIELISFVLPQIQRVNYNYNRKKFLNNEYVLKRLYALQDKIFKDTEKMLLKSIIGFFKTKGNNKEFNYRTKNFNLIWEIIVEQHLNENLLELNKEDFLVDKGCMKFNFQKRTFKVGNRHIEVDHYYEDKEKIFIVDSKYYDFINELNYKQVSYDYFLRKKDKKNVNILILPSVKDKVKEHFNYEKENILIIEYHFSIRNIIENYI